MKQSGSGLGLFPVINPAPPTPPTSVAGPFVPVDLSGRMLRRQRDLLDVQQRGPGFIPIIPPQVTGLNAIPVSSTEIDLIWTAAPGATSYTVRRNGVTVGTPTGVSFADTGLTSSTLYTYTVAANGTGGQGPFSSPSTATTQASGSAAVLLLNETWATPTTLGTFPAGTTYSGRWSGVGDTGQSRNIQSSPVNFNGGNVGYFTLNPSGCVGAGSTCVPTGSIHSMVVSSAPQIPFVAAKAYWMGFGIFMTGGWAPNGTPNGITGGFDIILQFHPPDRLSDGTTVLAGPYANPMVTIQPINGPGTPFQFNIIGRTSTTFTGGTGGTPNCIANPSNPVCNSPGSLNRNITYDIGMVTLNTWLGFAINFQISTLPDGSDGFMRGYFSPGIGQPWTLAFSDVGANDYYSDSARPNFSVGEYHGEGSRPVPPGPQAARQIAYSPIRFGRADSTGNCNLADVIPWGGNH